MRMFYFNDLYALFHLSPFVSMYLGILRFELSARTMLRLERIICDVSSFYMNAVRFWLTFTKLIIYSQKYSSTKCNLSFYKLFNYYFGRPIYDANLHMIIKNCSCLFSYRSIFILRTQSVIIICPRIRSHNIT